MVECLGRGAVVEGLRAVVHFVGDGVEVGLLVAGDGGSFGVRRGG